jgi:hypothetical protein
MSNSINAIKEIKNLMKQFGFYNEEPTLLSFKLSDDTILQTEKLVEGSKIFKINEGFEQVALEDGSYRLVENFELEVKDGQITSVREIFVEAKLVDGTVVKVEGDSLVEGAAVKVVTEQGEVPAPDGVHELEDGSKIEVKDGVIAAIKAVESEMENPAEDASENELPEGKSVEIEVMELVKDFVKKMSEKMEALQSQLNKVENEFSSFKKEPAGKKISDGKTEFNKQTNFNDDLDMKIQMIKSLRNNQ